MLTRPSDADSISPPRVFLLIPPVLTGLLYILLFPLLNLGWLAWFAFIPLLMAAPRLTFKRAMLSCGLAGFLGHLGTLSWIYSTCRFAKVSVPVSLLAWISLAAYLALYWAAFGGLVRSFERLPAALRPVLAAASWAGLEWVRSHAFTGFPWLLLSYSQWQWPSLISAAAWGGPHMVSFHLILVNAILAFWFANRKPSVRGGVLLALTPSLTISAAVTWATWTENRKPLEPAGPPISVALVQGNIDQYKKWDLAYEEEIVRTYTSLTEEAALQKPDLIVWPETSVPGWIPNEDKYFHWLQTLSRKVGSFMLIGAASHQKNADYNAAFMFSPLGDMLSQYRKQHLVPFGEVIPFQGILTRVFKVLNELGAFHASEDKTVFRVGRVFFSVNICFEDLFPGLVADFMREGAQMNVNMTNDGWYMDTAAPEQHFIANVFRAVETRAWVLRATNTGISGFIDPRGNIVSRTPLLRSLVLMGNPYPMSDVTFYVRHGDFFAKGCAAAALIGLAAAIFFRRKDLVP